jgi:hypothetical protein
MSNRTSLNGKFLTPLLIGIFVMGIAFIAGCKKSNGNPVDTGQTVTVSDDDADAADAVSDALASNNGGAMDQVNDVFEIAGGTGVGGDAGANMLAKSYSDSVSLSFNSRDTSWSLYVYRNRGNNVWSRSYRHQFIGPSGKAQAVRVGAVLIKHQLLSGTGHFQTLRLIHDLTSISSNWTASINADTTVTINGTYSRAGRDSVILGARKGTLMTDSLSLTFTDVKGPRGSRLSRSENTRGTISGVYIATVSVPGKATRTITKTFTITLGGGNATFTIDGTKFTADLATGDH